MTDFPYPLGAGSAYTETWESILTNPNGGDTTKVYAYGSWQYEQKYIERYNRRYTRLGINEAAQWGLNGTPIAQQPYGLCVTSAFTHWLMSKPSFRLNEPTVDVNSMYWLQREMNAFMGPGSNYIVGFGPTLADMFVAKGYAESYLWIESLDELKYWLRAYGPVIMECAWKDDMWLCDSSTNYFLRTSGNQVSKHATLCYGFNNRTGIYSFVNSWGTWWGNAGRFKLTEEQVNFLFFKERPDPKYSPIGRALGMIKMPTFPGVLGSADSPY